jgi:hypothetical protein
MKTVRVAALFVVLAVGMSAIGAPNAVARFPVGVGQPTGKVVRGTTAPGGSLTIVPSDTCFLANGTRSIRLDYQNAQNIVVHTRVLSIDAACTSVTDNFGTVVSATCPTTENNAASAYITQRNATISNAAASGKLNL